MARLFRRAQPMWSGQAWAGQAMCGKLATHAAADYNEQMDATTTPTAARLVLSNCPSSEVARMIARQLIERRLAACVNVLAPCHSVYEWQGEVCEESEVPLLIKTSVARYAAVEALIRELHPYELPEIVAVDIAAGSPAYLAWVEGQTADPANE